MSIPAQIEKLCGLYSREVDRQRTRLVALPGRKCTPRIVYTFLGFELKAGRKRIACPDMGTARYLKIFAEIGMPSIRIPYDPTQTGRLLPELEGCLEKIKELLLEEGLHKAQHQRRLRRIYREIRRLLIRVEGDNRSH